MSDSKSVDWSPDQESQVKNTLLQTLIMKIKLDIATSNYSAQIKYLNCISYVIAAVTITLSSLNIEFQYTILSSFTVVFVVLGKTYDELKNVYIKYLDIERYKSQLVKYEMLHERIENELNLDISDRQNASEFIYWIQREYHQIQRDDPEKDPRVDDEFQKICDVKNIKIPGIFDKLGEVLNSYNSPRTRRASTEINKITEENSKYKNTLKNYNPDSDLIWTIQRLEALNDNKNNSV